VSAHAEHHHASAPRTYRRILLALFALTVITVGASTIEFGPLNVVIALSIASVKGSLVALYFMHLRDDRPMNAIIFLSGVVFLGVFLIFCLIDTGARGYVRPVMRTAPEVTQTAPLQPQQPAVHQP
jgi:cytochrome c oxidase subunit 4